MRAQASEQVLFGLQACRIRASITVFLSLTLLLILTLVGALCESAAIQTGKNRAKARTSLALESVFAEYDTDLLEQYHIFAYDAGRTGQSAEKGVCDRIRYYGGESEISVDRIQLLTDHQAQMIYEQALLYMQRKEESLEQAISEHQADVCLWQQAVGEQILDAVKGETFAGLEEIITVFSLPLAQAVMPHGRVLSGGTINLANSASHRELYTGRGTFVSNGGGGLADDMVFDQYLTEVCDNAAVESDRLPAYEAEYLIAGKDSDKKNLDEVATRILAMRMAVNTAYLKHDNVKQAEMQTIAAFLSLAVGGVVVEPVIEEALTHAWAYAESMAEIRALLSGKRIAARKTAQSWKVGAAGILSLHRSIDEKWETDDQEGGLSYEDYLRILLTVVPRGKKSLRLADLIEINVSKARGGKAFLADHAVCRLCVQSVCHLERGIVFRYKNIFVYR